MALARYGLRTRDFADLFGKNPSTVNRSLNAGLQLERDDDEFRCRLDSLDQAISDRVTGNTSMRYEAPINMSYERGAWDTQCCRSGG